MKKNVFILSMLVILATACSNDDIEVQQSYDQEESNLSTTKSAVTFAGETDNVSVLIFGEDSNEYYYQKSISSGWSVDGKVSTLLTLGKYKFLFVKSAGAHTSIYPNPLNSSSSFSSIKFEAKPNTGKPNYVLPVDEMWLPETKKMADSVYTIVDKTTVKNKLRRAVSQVVLHVKRASVVNGVITELPYDNGNIMKNIDEITLDIQGVGEAVNIEGGIGKTNTLYTSKTATITGEGFASFEGPFVFPPAGNDKATVDITVTPAVDSAFPEMKKTVQGYLERNKKLEITLYVTATYQFINVTVEIEPISDEEDGDTGIWE